SDITNFDLEDPTHLARLQDPMLALQDLHGLIIIDEVQRTPRLFEVIRVLVDREPRRARFLILGSASRDLIQQSSETLAGRISHIELTPFLATEVGKTDVKKLWTRGGYPLSFLAKSETVSGQWRKAYITTYLERDIPALGIQIPAATLRRFWMMLTHYHGQVVNYSELGRSFGIADTTARKYIDILAATYMIRQLPPWFENLKKRQVKSPKIYLRDSGILHTLLGVEDGKSLNFHPKLGASWEGFAIEQIIHKFGAEEGECYFWSAYGRAEIDLLLIKNGKRLGFEIKHTSTPKITTSLLTAQQDLALDETLIVFPGKESFPLSPTIRAVGLEALLF
ncbi:MAG: ATP-binding protein, partial [Gammaproteobacteria bacterium]|nr:ATP-binding protein [Gammaproteobacteria bacterium]